MANIGEVLDLADSRFAEISILDQNELFNTVFKRDDKSDDRAEELYKKIEQLSHKERKDGTLNNRDRRVQKKCEKQKEELEATGLVVAWIEEDVVNMIEEAKEEMEEEEKLKSQYKKDMGKSSPKKPAAAEQVWSDEEDDNAELRAKMQEKVAAVVGKAGKDDADSDSYVKVSKEDAAGYDGQGADQWKSSADKWAGYDAQGNWVGYGNEGNSGANSNWQQQDNTRWDTTLQKYVPLDTFDDVSDSSDDEDEDEAYRNYWDEDFEGDFSNHKKEKKKKDDQKKAQAAAAKKHAHENKHVYEAEDYFDTILRKVENLKGKGKPVYTLAAKKLYQKGLGKAEEKKGIQRAGPGGSVSTVGKGMGAASYSSVYDGVADAMADQDDEDDEEEEDDPELVAAAGQVTYDEWGDVVDDGSGAAALLAQKKKAAAEKKKKRIEAKAAARKEQMAAAGVSPGYVAPEYDIAEDAQVLVCPVCTFHNHIANTNCDMCGASLEQQHMSRTIMDAQKDAFKEIRREEKKKLLKGKGKGAQIEDEVERDVVIGGDGRIKVVQKTQDDVKKEKLAKKQMMAETEGDDAGGDEDDEEEQFFARAMKVQAGRKLNQGGDFTAQFVGNGKLNPAAEAAIKEQIEREEQMKAEREERERKAARKEAKKAAQQKQQWFDEGSAPVPLGGGKKKKSSGY